MSVSLIAVPPEGLHRVWPLVLTGLEGERIPPEYVLEQCSARRSCLFLITVNGSAIGFFVMQDTTDYEGRCLFVWLMWAYPGKARPHWDAIYDEVERLAKGIGVSKIRMQSARKGWRGSRERFKPVATVYEYEVT